MLTTCMPLARPRTIGTSGSTKCLATPAGYYSDSIGESSASACGVGKYAVAVAQSQCEPCKDNFFNDQHGATACTFVLRGHCSNPVYLVMHWSALNDQTTTMVQLTEHLLCISHSLHEHILLIYDLSRGAPIHIPPSFLPRAWQTRFFLPCAERALLSFPMLRST